MGNYLVSLKEADTRVAPAGRADVYGRNLSRTTSFRHDLERWLTDNQLEPQVAGIGDPSGFPLLSMTCTAQVAQAIAAFPEVEAVVADDNSLRLF
jgi:hypothetical protein